MEHFDLVIVGAGWHGLATAKTFLEVNPTANVVVLDSAQTIGGVWATERLYPGLQTNNMLGTYEFSDFPMTTERFGVNPGQHIPGSVIHKYLRQYAEEFTISQRIRYRCTVLTAEMRGENVWELTILDDRRDDRATETRMLTEKLVVATGLTSEPFMPMLEGSENFKAPLFHVKYFHNRAETDDNIRNVAVLGTSKSASDVCYAYATRDVQVYWVIRSSGHGPAWMAPPYVTPFKLWLEQLVLTRFLTWFSPCIWGDADGYGWIRWALHRTWLGMLFVSAFWYILGNDVVDLIGYDKHPETRKLKPWNEPFWVASGLAICNYDTDFLQLVRDGKIKIHVADITRLSEKTVHLSDEISFPADTLVCSTGWVQRPSVKFLPEGIDDDFGLPHYSEQSSELFARADEEVLRLFPRLRSQPQRNVQYKPLSPSMDLGKTHAPNQPYRLYRFMVPLPSHLLHTRNLAFAGAYLSVSTVTVAQVQALWITAYFHNSLPSVDSPNSYSTDEIEWDTILHSQFGKWRHPAAAGGYGERFPDMAFDTLPYVDLLLQDLGLKSHRKKGWWWNEWFLPYGQSDYRGLVVEWTENVRQRPMEIPKDQAHLDTKDVKKTL